MKLLLPLLLYLLCCGQPVYALSITTEVIAVLDGDTFLIRQTKGIKKIRLAYIDAPEKQQPYGPAAKKKLSELILKRTVNIETIAVDHYGRFIAEVKYQDTNINYEMIRLGYAWEYRYRKHDEQLRELQTLAQQQKRGLWQDSSPEEPWLWRKQNQAQHKPPPSFCEQKRYCSQMSSCQEAKTYVVQCAYLHLDADQDGVPCEHLCLAH